MTTHHPLHRTAVRPRKDDPMLLKTYVTVALFLAAAPQALARRAEAKRAQDGGLATLEWVALAIVAVTIAAGAYAGINAVVNRKIGEIK
jgi:hypothetical protein